MTDDGDRDVVLRVSGLVKRYGDNEVVRGLTFAIRRGDWVLILAPTGDDNRAHGEPPWFRKDRGYTSHTEPGELFNLATDPTQRHNLYATEAAKVNELAALMERHVTEGRSTPVPRQDNDVDIVWDKRAAN